CRREDQFRGLVSGIHLLVQRFGSVVFVGEGRVFKIWFLIAGLERAALLDGNRTRVRDRPFFGREIKRSLEQRVVSLHLFELFWIILRQRAHADLPIGS